MKDTFLKNLLRNSKYLFKTQKLIELFILEGYKHLDVSQPKLFF